MELLSSSVKDIVAWLALAMKRSRYSNAIEQASELPLLEQSLLLSFRRN